MPRKSKKEPDASVPRRVTRRSVQQQDLEDACKPEASSSKVASSPTAKQSAKKAASPVTSPSVHARSCTLVAGFLIKRLPGDRFFLVLKFSFLAKI